MKKLREYLNNLSTEDILNVINTVKDRDSVYPTTSKNYTTALLEEFLSGHQHPLARFNYEKAITICTKHVDAQLSVKSLDHLVIAA